MTFSLLAKNIEKYTEGLTRFDTAVQGMAFHRAQSPTQPVSYTLSPHLCLIAQGVKHVMLGEEEYTYDANGYLISSVDLPVVSEILEASQEKPYLGLTLELDLNEIARLIADGNLPEEDLKSSDRGMAVGVLSAALSDAVRRLTDLLNTPQDIAILAPAIKREIYYRLLTDGQGIRLRQIVSAGSQNNKIARAINWLKDHFAQPFHVQELAGFIGMSPSSFHQHFRSLTAMSPLQFQKRIRLNEARRLMLIEKMDAGAASFQVGYESPTQFSREYKRMFGQPPRASVKKLENPPVVSL